MYAIRSYYVLFGAAAGTIIWVIQMVWIPFWAAGVINGIGHWWGYRNYELPDASRNIVPWAVFIGGEELHNNHHTYPSSAKFSSKWWELDIGWVYVRLLQALGLANVRKVPPKPAFNPAKKACVITSYSIHYTKLYDLRRQQQGWNYIQI